MNVLGLLLLVVIFSEFVHCIRGNNLQTTSNTNTVYYNSSKDNAISLKRSLQGGGNIHNKCVLTVTNKSKANFTRSILKNRYNFVYLRLTFSPEIIINETEYVIGKTHWLWTYKGEGGAHQYLFLPGDYGYLSFGILWSHTLVDELVLDIRNNSHCAYLTVGTNGADQLIGDALGNMTAEIASQDDNYNSSYWCYNRRVWLESTSMYIACKNSICTFQTFEYECCKFKLDFATKERHVECKKEHYHFGELWWMLPIIIGELCFGFYPLLLAKIGHKVIKISRRVAWNMKSSFHSKESSLYIRSVQRSDDVSNGDFEDSVNDTLQKKQYIHLKRSHPVTFWSTIFSPAIYCCSFNGTLYTRCIRLLIIFLPMSLSTIRILLDNHYNGFLVKEAVSKGALVGFSSIIAGYKASRKEFLYILGGPVIAVTIYVMCGCILLVLPHDLGCFLEKGFFKGKRQNNFLLTMSIKQKERLGRIMVSNFTGYKKMHHYLLVQTYMLLNIRFWYQAILLFNGRWKRIVDKPLKRIFRMSLLVHVFEFFIFLFYVIFCALELIVSVIYFAFPVISCFFILMRACSISFFGYFRDKSILAKAVGNIICVPLLLLFVVVWYMYCIIFFDGLWFLSKIAMFTYSGIIAYPKLSYGYLILALMAIYYLVESSNNFGERYKELLKVSIEACQKVQTKSLEDDSTPTRITINKGIPIDLYHMIVERHLCLRIQVWLTLLKFVSVVSVLAISIVLLITFDKFNELSMVSHVFTVVFICALPKIVRILCSDVRQHKARKKLLKNIQLTVNMYLRDGGEDNGSATEPEIYASIHGYETFDNANESDSSD